MSNPPLFDQPDSMLSPYFHSDSSDNFGVHVNSGVSNKAAYLLVDGGSHNPGTGAVSVSPIGADRTARLFYEVQTTLLTPGAQFGDLANAMRQACRNLTGRNGFTLATCTSVDQAIRATAMDRPPTFMAPYVPAECVQPNRMPAPDLLHLTFEEGDTTKYVAGGVAGTYLDWSHPDPSYPSEGRPGLVGWDTQVFSNPSGSRTPGDVTIMPDRTVTFPTMTPGTEMYLSFDQAYDMEWLYDGGVVEYSVNGGAWRDLLTDVAAVNAQLVFNGYDASLQDTTPLGTRPAFTGTSPGYFTTRVGLPASLFSNTTARFRWRMASDQYVVGNDQSRFPGAWLIDDVRVYSCVALPSAPGFPTATAGERQATVTWPAPEVNANTVTGYIVTPYRNGVAQAPVHTNSTSRSHVVTGLTGGARYQFSVTAVNANGTSRESGLSNAVTPTSPAGTPTTIPGGGTGGGGTGGGTGGGGAGSPLFREVTPRRLFDTRTSEPHGAITVTKQRYGGNNVLRVNVTGTAGIPTTGVGAVSLNVTAVAPSGHGFVPVYPCGDLPNVSNVNYTPGSISPNAVITPVSATGEICLYSYADTDLIADINGWFATG